MSKVPIIDDAEREVIRRRLNRYREAHGNMGVPKLYECMLFALDYPDHYYLDLKSLQRFLRDDHRTSDEKVVRYRKFLERENAGGEVGKFAAALGQLLVSRRLVPEFVTPKMREAIIEGELYYLVDEQVPFDEYYWRRPLSGYHGRYEIDLPDGAGDNAEEVAPKRHMLLLPTDDENSLKAVTLSPMEFDGAPDGGGFYHVDMFDALFMKAGFGQFVMISAGHADMAFTVFTETGEEGDGAPVILSGTTLQTAHPGIAAADVVRVTLTQIAGTGMSVGDEEPT